MSRKIKFRAWDKEERCMIYNVQDTYDYRCRNNGALAESFKEVLEDAIKQGGTTIRSYSIVITYCDSIL